MRAEYLRPRLAAVRRLLDSGSIAKARAACRRVLRETPDDPAAIHLLGLIQRADEDLATAERCIRTSVALAPASAEYRASLGRLLRDLGRAAEAERTCREALALDPSSTSARTELVRALVDLGRHADAESEARAFAKRHAGEPGPLALLAATVRGRGRPGEAAALYRKALAESPDDPAINHELGTLWSEMDRAEEALDALLHARRAGAKGYGIAVDLGRAWLELYRFDEAEAAFAEAVAARPREVAAQVQLARVRFARGDADFDRDLASAAAGSDRPGPGMAHARMLRAAGLLERAEAELAALLSKHGRAPELLAAIAGTLHESGRLPEARALALEALQARPADRDIVENAVAVLLSCGDASAAMQCLAPQRARDPLCQGWLAYEAIAIRLADPDRYRELYDFATLVRSFALEPPAGFDSIPAFNEALLEAFRSRHAHPTHPAGETFRHGSRTMRSLLTDPDPAIRAAMTAFEAPVEDYRAALGTSGLHPVAARNTGPARLERAWAVTLRGGGFHASHFHARAWISAAYCVAAPRDAADTAAMPGWLRFGEPRVAVPGAGAERFIRPEAGRLILFPACLWHGSNPIGPGNRRTVIAFDALPSDPL